MVPEVGGGHGITIYVGKTYHRSSVPLFVMTNSEEINGRIFVVEGPVGQEYKCVDLEEIVHLAKENDATFITDERTLKRLLEQSGVRTSFYDRRCDTTDGHSGLKQVMDAIRRR